MAAAPAQRAEEQVAWPPGLARRAATSFEGKTADALRGGGRCWEVATYVTSDATPSRQKDAAPQTSRPEWPAVGPTAGSGLPPTRCQMFPKVASCGWAAAAGLRGRAERSVVCHEHRRHIGHGYATVRHLRNPPLNKLGVNLPARAPMQKFEVPFAMRMPRHTFLAHATWREDVGRTELPQNLVPQASQAAMVRPMVADLSPPLGPLFVASCFHSLAW